MNAAASIFPRQCLEHNCVPLLNTKLGFPYIIPRNAGQRKDNVRRVSRGFVGEAPGGVGGYFFSFALAAVDAAVGDGRKRKYFL